MESRHRHANGPVQDQLNGWSSKPRPTGLDFICFLPGLFHYFLLALNLVLKLVLNYSCNLVFPDLSIWSPCLQRTSSVWLSHNLCYRLLCFYFCFYMYFLDYTFILPLYFHLFGLFGLSLFFFLFVKSHYMFLTVKVFQVQYLF